MQKIRKSKSDQKKPKFNITYYPAFWNVRNILQESHILLTPDIFRGIPVVGFCNGKNLKDHLVRAKLPNVEITGRSESCGKGNCQVCDFICCTDNFTTKACGEAFKFQSGILNCYSQKVIYHLKCRVRGEAPYVGRAKAKFWARLNDYKSAHRSYIKKCKVSQQRVHEHYGQHSHNGVDDWQFTFLEQCGTHEREVGSSWKRGKHFGNTSLKHFTLMGLMKRKNIYIKSSFLTFL